MFKEAVSKRIYELCDLYNFSLNHLAEMSGVAPTTLYDIVNYKVDNPSSYVIYKICKTFKIDVKDFFDSNIFKKLDD